MRKIYLLLNKIFDFLLTSKIITSKNIIDTSKRAPRSCALLVFVEKYGTFKN